MSYEEKLHLFKVAAARPEWQNAALFASLALNTTMRGCEIKQLRWGDIDLIERTLTVRNSKTEAGQRIIPLNSDAWDVALALYRRSRALGATQAGNYVFPACETAQIDPTKPEKSWRTSWRHLTRVVACPRCTRLQIPEGVCSDEACGASLKGLKSPIAGLRFHDLRHHAITELAESQASESTVMSIAGHVSPKMLQHYSHIRMEAKRSALDSLSMKRPSGADLSGTIAGYDTTTTQTRGTRVKPLRKLVI